MFFPWWANELPSVLDVSWHKQSQSSIQNEKIICFSTGAMNIPSTLVNLFLTFCDIADNVLVLERKNHIMFKMIHLIHRFMEPKLRLHNLARQSANYLLGKLNLESYKVDI